MSELFCVVNGEFIPLRQAGVPVNDLAVQRGYGVFDFFRTLRGKPVFWNDHLDRLERSCRELRLPIDRRGILGSLRELAKRNGLADSGLRITVTGGNSPDGYSIADPNVIIVQQPIILPPAAPLRLITYEHQRQLPHVKSIDYTMAIYLRRQVLDRGADEVLYHDAGKVSECPRANIFVVTAEGALATPSRRILAGITRARVLKLASDIVETEERDLTLVELREACEVFITSTSRKIVPVCKIDGQRVGDGSPGRVTRALLERFEAHLEAEIA